MRVLVLLCIAVMGSSISAQDYITGSYSHIGNLSYGYFSDGSSSITTRIGNMEYVNIWVPPKPWELPPLLIPVPIPVLGLPLCDNLSPEPNWDAGIGFSTLKTEPDKPNAADPVQNVVENKPVRAKNPVAEARKEKQKAAREKFLNDARKAREYREKLAIANRKAYREKQGQKR